MARTILAERDGRVGRIWLNRPDVRNAFNAVMIGELRDALRSLAGDAAVSQPAGAATQPAAGPATILNFVAGTCRFRGTDIIDEIPNVLKKYLK